MRRSITYCEPPAVAAGSITTVFCHFQTASTLAKGARLKFDLMSGGRDVDWEKPSVDPKATGNVLYGLMEDDTVIHAKEVEIPNSILPQYEFVLPKAIEVGETFSIVIGEPATVKKGGKSAGTRVQTMVERRKPFQLFIDPKGKGNYDSSEQFSIDIRGNVLETINILAPSLVVRNKRFDITIRFEDAYGNLTGLAPEGTMVDLSYENIRENLNWKLFVPETGFVTLPNLYFNEPGVYRLRLNNLKSGKLYTSAPIKCLADTSHLLYWGLLHGESTRIDSAEGIETCLRHLRDDCDLNFVSTSPFEASEETSNDIWKLLQHNVATFNEEDRFSAFLGFQWKGESPGEGVRLLIHAKDNKPLLRAKDLKYNALQKLYRLHKPQDLMAIPTFTMGKGYGYDFAHYSPDYERVVEIYNAWGSSECTAKEGNPRPITSKGKKGISEFADGSVQKALAAGCRFGFVAGGLDDRGIYSGLYEADQVQYSPGLTAILSAKHTREALLEALYKRSCYATTGERIVIGLTCAGTGMGGELSTGTKPGLKVNRHLAGYVAGSNDLEKLEIVRNGKVLVELPFEGNIAEFAYDDMDDLDSVAFPAAGENSPFVYYYLRVTQKDGHMAWSSPIWITVVDGAAGVKRAKKKGE